jgi:hypothetical protein
MRRPITHQRAARVAAVGLMLAGLAGAGGVSPARAGPEDPAPGAALRDCAGCPVMVRLPASEVVLGSAPDAPHRHPHHAA